MHMRRAMCPKCRSILAVPPGMGGSIVRCGRCSSRFRLPKTIAVTDEAISSWLHEDRHERGQTVAIEESRKAATKAAMEENPSGQTQILPAIATGEIRLVKVSRRGAMFEFPSDRLTDSTFRCAMPRRCMRCGTRAHLHVHVIIFAHQLVDSVSLEAEHSAGSLKLSEQEVRALTGEEILARLPNVPNVPRPGDNPMPYWLCDMCSAAGVVSGQINANSETGKGWCRLLIHNLRRSEEFLAAAGGKDNESYAELKKWVEATAETPWDTVPLVVQHRLEQWFHPAHGEQFTAYIPDRDRGRNEDGMCGLLISNRRLIYHTDLRHRESEVSAPLELQLAQGSGKSRLQIKTAQWQVKHFTLDRDGIEKIRRGLIKGKFKANWL